MMASKVSFSAHTKEMLNARPLSRKHKAGLRRQRIVEFIRELPYGECKKSDLIEAAGWDISVKQQYANGWSFIERLRKYKVIQMSEGSNPKNSYIKKWVVMGDVHIVRPAHADIGPGYTHSEGDNCLNKPTKRTIINNHGDMMYPEGDGEISIKEDGYLPPRTALQLEPVIPVEEEPKPINLLEAAKEFAWNTNSDSLREFVAWVKR
jgi:hypothetical protein